LGRSGAEAWGDKMTLTDEQIKERVRYIGGTDAAAILGLSRWKTPLAVWAEKTGQIEPEDISERLNVKLGNMLEDAVAKLFAEETGKKVHRANETIAHRKHDFLCANIDRRVVGEDAILECKTASGWKAKEWEGEEIPTEYIVQVMHYLMVTGASKGYIAVLIGNEKFVWKEIPRDEQMIKQMMAREVEFWEKYVVPKTMPTLIKHNDDETLYKLFPVQTEEKTAQFGDEQMRIVESIQAMTADVMALERQIDKAKNELKAVMQDAAVAAFGDKKVATWKEVTSNKLDTKAFKEAHPDVFGKFSVESKSRVFRLAK